MEAGDYENFDERIRLLVMLYRKLKKKSLELVAYKLLVDMFTKKMHSRFTSIEILLFFLLSYKLTRRTFRFLFIFIEDCLHEISKLSKEDTKHEYIAYVFNLQTAAATYDIERYFQLMLNSPKSCSLILNNFIDTERKTALKEIIRYIYMMYKQKFFPFLLFNDHSISTLLKITRHMQCNRSQPI